LHIRPYTFNDSVCREALLAPRTTHLLCVLILQAPLFEIVHFRACHFLLDLEHMADIGGNLVSPRFEEHLVHSFQEFQIEIVHYLPAYSQLI
jgi:hypothetical protein